jgi:hypothetical protein
MQVLFDKVDSYVKLIIEHENKSVEILRKEWMDYGFVMEIVNVARKFKKATLNRSTGGHHPFVYFHELGWMITSNMYCLDRLERMSKNNVFVECCKHIGKAYTAMQNPGVDETVDQAVSEYINTVSKVPLVR